MKPTQLDQVRDALRRETEQLQPVGLDFEDVKRRGSHRRNRGRALVAVATVTCLAGAGVAVSQRSGGKHVVDVASNSNTPPPALQFRVIDGKISNATHFTSSDGVTYALSTAPGVAANPAQPGQAIYSTTDGEHWTTADQGKPWISDLAAGNGVLYAIGTSPGAGANDINYLVGTSHDGGKQWSDAALPFDMSTPNATVGLSRSLSVHIARNASTTVALLTEQFYPDLDALVQARTAGRQNVSTQQTADGYEMLDIAACIAAKQAAMADATGGATASTTVGGDATGGANTPTTLGGNARFVGESTCTTPPVLGTITWSDIGLHSAADVTRQQELVSSDGTHWDSATAPATGLARNLVASGDGFLLLADSGHSFNGFNGGVPGTATTLMRSSDADTWTTVPTPADLNVQAISGDRAIGVDGNGVLQTSNDGGTTWTTTNAKAQLPAGATGTAVEMVLMLDAGPLGFAAVVNADDVANGHSPGYYLLFSTDGINWSTSDLATAGRPANTYPEQVIVGADHIGVDFQESVGTPNTPSKTTTLLATPER